MFAAEGCQKGDRVGVGGVCKGCAIKFALLFAAAFPVRGETRRGDTARVAWLFTQSSAERSVLWQRNRYKRISRTNPCLFICLCR